jgi:hypothetical protein
MIEVKNVPPHHRVGRTKEEGRAKEEERVEEEGREENQGRCCIRHDKGRKVACEDQKMTKPEDNPVPKMVRKWVPKIATPAKSIDPK